MISKKYFTKLGYAVEFLTQNANLTNGRIQGGYEIYSWDENTLKVVRKLSDGREWEDFEDEDYDLVENIDLFIKKAEFKPPPPGFVRAIKSRNAELRSKTKGMIYTSSWE